MTVSRFSRGGGAHFLIKEGGFILTLLGWRGPNHHQNQRFHVDPLRVEARRNHTNGCVFGYRTGRNKKKTRARKIVARGDPRDPQVLGVSIFHGFQFSYRFFAFLGPVLWDPPQGPQIASKRTFSNEKQMRSEAPEIFWFLLARRPSPYPASPRVRPWFKNNRKQYKSERPR